MDDVKDVFFFNKCSLYKKVTTFMGILSFVLGLLSFILCLLL